MKIPLLIPTRKRSCQLDLLLRSIKKNVPDLFDIQLLYKKDEGEFEDGYDLLFQRFPAIEIRDGCEYYNGIKPPFMKVIEEKNIEGDFRTFLSQHPYFCIASDDCVVYRPIKVTSEQVITLFEDEVFCVSFRLGLNCIIQDPKIGSLQQSLEDYERIFFVNKNSWIKEERDESDIFIKWMWKCRPALENFGYPSGQDFCCYRSQDYLDLLTFPFTTLRHVESELTHRRLSILREYMISPKISYIVNIPSTNCQQPFIENGFNNYTLEELNQRYLEEEILDINNMDFSDIQGCHQYIEYQWKDIRNWN